MTDVGIEEAKVILPDLVERALHGEEIILTHRGTRAVRLVPMTGVNAFPNLAGAWQGRVELAGDFDELPDELADEFGTCSD